MSDKKYWLEKWKEMKCDFMYVNEICIGNCSSCQYFPDMNLINCEEIIVKKIRKNGSDNKWRT